MREEPHHLALLDNHLEVASGLLEKHREALELPEKHQEEDSELQEAALVQEEPLRLELQEKVLEASVLQENRQAPKAEPDDFNWEGKQNTFGNALNNEDFVMPSADDDWSD